MRLNPDIIRNILFVVETHTDVNTPVSSDELYSDVLLSSFNKNEIDYHVRQADLSGLLYKVSYFKIPSFVIEDLSPDGHKFLNNIREKPNWSKTKTVAKNIGSFSIDALKDISSSVISELISKQFNQN